MTIREALIVIAFVGILIYVLGTTYDALVDCRAAGGVLVRGMFAPQCVIPSPP